MSEPMFLTLDEVIERYRGQISEGTLRNWRSMRVGPSFRLRFAARAATEYQKFVRGCFKLHQYQ
jgi:hypothetical protein